MEVFTNLISRIRSVFSGENIDTEDKELEFKKHTKEFYYLYNQQCVITGNPFVFSGRSTILGDAYFENWESGPFRQKEEMLLTDYNIVKAVTVVLSKANSGLRLIDKLRCKSFFMPVRRSDILDSWIDECRFLDENNEFLKIFDTWDKKDSQHYYLCVISKSFNVEVQSVLYTIKVNRYKVEPKAK